MCGISMTKKHMIAPQRDGLKTPDVNPFKRIVGTTESGQRENCSGVVH